MRKTFSISLRLSLLTVLALCLSAWQPSRPIPASYFTLHTHARDGLEEMFDEAPFKLLRLWDSATDWASLEPEQGEWYWDTLDWYMEEALAHDKDVLLVLGMTPFWASSDPSALSPYGSSSSAPPARLEDWENYIRVVAERNERVYGGAIKYWEVWNEPDHPTVPFYSGSIEELVDLAAAAKRVLKDVNPTYKIVSPGITEVGGRWLEQFLKLGAKDSVDIVGFHFYWDYYSSSIPAFRTVIGNMTHIKRQAGCGDKPLWLTEVGVSTDWYDTLETQQMGLVEMLTSAWYYGSEIAGVYAWNNCIFTTMYSCDTLEVNELGVAYETLYPWLIGSSIRDIAFSYGSSRYVELERGGATGRIIWNYSRSPEVYSIDETWGDYLYYLDGTMQVIPADRSIVLGNAPILIPEEGFVGE